MRLARYIIVPLILAALVGGTPAARAEARHAAMVIDANTGQVLHAQAADDPRFPASLTKMMTLYMAFELIDMGRLSYQSKIKISQEAASAAPSKLDLDPGEEITALDAIKALITKSANDIAIAMAEHIGGSEANFARLMTARARQIGMSKTTFRNASGLPDPGQTTTARDMLTLALRLQDDFPRHYGLFATRSFSYNGGTHRNHNTLLGSFAGTDGIKTGYTRASGFNLVTSVRRDGRHLVAVVFGGSTAASRNAQMRSLLSRAIGRASTKKTRRPMLIAKPRIAPRPLRMPAQKTEVAAVTPPSRLAVGKSADAQSAPPVVPNVEVAFAPRIEIAKVRRVMVAPRAKPRPAESTEEPAEYAARLPRNSISAGFSPSADAPARRDETIVAKAPARQPLADAPQRIEPPLLPPARREADQVVQPAANFDIASANSPPMGPSGAPGTGLGRPPSTLQQQAVLLGSERVDGPVRVAATDSPGLRHYTPPRAAAAGTSIGLPPVSTSAQPISPNAGFQIQVGAYASAGEAARQLSAVRSRAGSMLQARESLALPVLKGSRQLFRARFAGFDANGAANTCLELRRLGVDCFVMRAE